MQKTLQIPRFHAECCKTQVLGPYHGGGRGGGGSEPRTGIIYIYTIIYVYIIAPDSGMRNADEIITYNYCHSNCGGGGPDQVVVSD